MTVLKCENCGGITNSAGLCEHDYNGKTAKKCYAKHDGKKWVKGCTETNNPYDIDFIKKILREK